MLTFYYHPLSPIARRVWVALLEKGLDFEPRLVPLNGAQFQPEFLALNPFHHVPVLVDGDLRVLESLAILDYLEAQYPTPALTPTAPAAVAHMRMVQMVVVNELTPKLPAMLDLDGPLTPDHPLWEPLDCALQFLTTQLQDDDYFGGDTPSLADITAGTTLRLLHRLGLPLAPYPAIAAWHDRLMARSAWQQTEPSDTDFATWSRWLALQRKRRQRQASKTS